MPSTPVPTGSKRAASSSPEDPGSSPLSDPLDSTPTALPGGHPFNSQPASPLRGKSRSKRTRSETGSRPSSSSVKEPETRLEGADLQSDDDGQSSEIDENDVDYHDDERQVRRQSTIAPEGSPKARKHLPSTISPEAKSFVALADPHKGACLLTNALHPKIMRQFAHIIARGTPAEKLTLLEWWWSMKYYSLYIDSRYNLLPLLAHLHLALDADLWTLVPSADLIQKVQNWVKRLLKRNKDGDVKHRSPISALWKDDTQFTYYILPLSDSMKQLAIHRCTDQFDPAIAEIRHIHPFASIGKLTSHVHPHFIIHAAGEKLAKIRASKLAKDPFPVALGKLASLASFGHVDLDKEQLIEYNRLSLVSILEIYDVWSNTEPVPPPGSVHKWRRRS